MSHETVADLPAFVAAKIAKEAWRTAARASAAADRECRQAAQKARFSGDRSEVLRLDSIAIELEAIADALYTTHLAAERAKEDAFRAFLGGR